MTILTALPVNMNDFKRLLVNVSPEHAVCVRGRHAVGKSEGVYQAAEEHLLADLTVRGPRDGQAGDRQLLDGERLDPGRGGATTA